uniref:Putative secreted protein n=1 Tax=Ixodes ricinus TaxID=34613 RepID=A0A6B0UHA3_IXORI
MSSALSVAAAMVGLMADTKAATSVALVHWMAWPLRYSQLLSWGMGWPRRSSLPLPCQVTSAVSELSGPKVTQAWSSERARWTSVQPSAWQAATTANATPKQSSLLPVR